jgi:hypothetical protein
MEPRVSDSFSGEKKCGTRGCIVSGWKPSEKKVYNGNPEFFGVIAFLLKGASTLDPVGA